MQSHSSNFPFFSVKKTLKLSEAISATLSSSSSSVLILCICFTALVLTPCILHFTSTDTQFSQAITANGTPQLEEISQAARSLQQGMCQSWYVPPLLIAVGLNSCRTVGQFQSSRSVIPPTACCKLFLCSNLNRTMLVTKQPCFCSQSLALLRS